MKDKKQRNAKWFYGSIFFFLTIALTIQIAVMVYDFIIQKTSDRLLIAVLMLNVILILTVLCTVIDALRRKMMVEKPVQEILQATEKIAKGDFTVRLEIKHEYGKYDEYDLIKENFNTMAAELGKTEVLKTDFISNVSHEIKTPLAVIENYAALLQDKHLDEETRKSHVKTVLSASKRLSGLITNILKLNKLEHQQIQPQYERFALDEALAQAALSYEEWIERKEISLSCDLEELQIYSAPSLLDIVWNNLISNAIKFTEQGGEISVRVWKRGKDAVVEVRDTGCGISPQTGARIFEKFYQGDTSHAQEGNGLGLALVKRVIDTLGGEISVQSKLGEGSVFTILLKGVVYEN